MLRLCSPPEGAVELAENASMLNTDRGYLEIQRIWIEKVIQRVKCPLMQIETNVMVPVEVTSFKEKYSAATIRQKINIRLKDFLMPLKPLKLQKNSLYLDFESLPLDNMKKLLASLEPLPVWKLWISSRVELMRH